MLAHLRRLPAAAWRHQHVRTVFSTTIERIDHITLMKTCRPLDAAEAERVQASLAALPGVAGVRMGAAHELKNAQGYNAVLVVSLLDEQALAAFVDSKVDIETSSIRPLLSENEDSITSVTYTYSHMAHLRPGPAMLIGGLAGGLLGGGVMACF
eukprot:CAMPEP_0174736098 /NCGR_PEP_ID=MMETSP1094-20130205/66059_1 /TAXON_ID=156173 /ORGANISM="Chrysochromulina brevifilum, Strain UTEX LB 985" /LENGTH=153 /DNA_ID=CAMNT_0015939149 /DNA_START=218 /DNA_END=679 /DNA_ORIENTATION=+